VDELFTESKTPGELETKRQMTNFRTGVAIAALMIGTPAMAEPHEVKVRPPVCETVTVAAVYPGCAKSEAMGEEGTAPHVIEAVLNGRDQGSRGGLQSLQLREREKERARRMGRLCGRAFRLPLLKT
jgi:hypothetical protein